MLHKKTSKNLGLLAFTRKQLYSSSCSLLLYTVILSLQTWTLLKPGPIVQKLSINSGTHVAYIYVLYITCIFFLFRPSSSLHPLVHQQLEFSSGWCLQFKQQNKVHEGSAHCLRYIFPFHSMMKKVEANACPWFQELVVPKLTSSTFSFVCY